MISQDNYIPLTEQEAINYIDNPVNREQLIQDIINLDIIEHTVPIVSNPTYGAVLLENGDLLLYPVDRVMVIRIGHLEYDITLLTYTFEKFYVEENKSRFIPGVIGFGIGCGIGLLVGLVGD